MYTCTYVANHHQRTNGSTLTTSRSTSIYVVLYISPMKSTEVIFRAVGKVGRLWVWQWEGNSVMGVWPCLRNCKFYTIDDHLVTDWPWSVVIAPLTASYASWWVKLNYGEELAEPSNVCIQPIVGQPGPLCAMIAKSVCVSITRAFDDDVSQKWSGHGLISLTGSYGPDLLPAVLYTTCTLHLPSR